MSTTINSKKARSIFILVFILFYFFPCWSDEICLLPQNVVQAIINEISGERALHNEIMLAPFEKIRKKEEFSTQFWESSYIIKKAKEYGLQEVELYTFPSDEPLWQAERGELWQLEPEKKKLADIKEIAASLAIGSQTTDIKAELIYLERASRDVDYKGKKVSGKIILTADRINSVQQLGVKKKGALGVISYASYSPPQYVDLIGWQWGLSRKEAGEKAQHMFGFSISRRLGLELKNKLLDGQKVVVQVEIKAEFHPGRDEVVSAIIPGSDLKQEEFVLIAHLFEGYSKQGANDNNSGSACILEVGRCLVKLIKEGKIKRPRRTIRFLWVPEYSGTVSFLEKYPEITKKMICGINMDMVGCDLYKNNSPFHIYRTPSSLPSYINYIAENIMDYAVLTNRVSIEGKPSARIVAPTGSLENFMGWMDEFDSGSDSDVFNFSQVKIPMVFFCNWTDDFYHSSKDAPQHSDPTQLKRAGFLGAAVTLAVAGAEDEDVLKIVAESISHIRSRLALCQKKAYSLLSISGQKETAEAYKIGENLIKQNYQVELEGLTSCASLTKNKTTINYIESLKEKLMAEKTESLQEFLNYYQLLCQMRGLEPEVLEATKKEKELAKLIPVLETKKIWPSFRKVDKKLKILNIHNCPYEVFNFIDGQRSILEIAQAVEAEFIDVSGISPELVEEYIKALTKAGLVKIKSSSSKK